MTGSTGCICFYSAPGGLIRQSLLSLSYHLCLLVSRHCTIMNVNRMHSPPRQAPRLDRRAIVLLGGLVYNYGYSRHTRPLAHSTPIQYIYTPNKNSTLHLYKLSLSPLAKDQGLTEPASPLAAGKTNIKAPPVFAFRRGYIYREMAIQRPSTAARAINASWCCVIHLVRLARLMRGLVVLRVRG